MNNSTSSTTTWSTSTGYSVAAVTLSLLFVALFACLMFCKMRDKPNQMILLQPKEESKEKEEDQQHMIHTLDSENFETIELETSTLEKKKVDPELVSDIESVTMPKQMS